MMEGPRTQMLPIGMGGLGPRSHWYLSEPLQLLVWSVGGGGGGDQWDRNPGEKRMGGLEGVGSGKWEVGNGKSESGERESGKQGGHMVGQGRKIENCKS